MTTQTRAAGCQAFRELCEERHAGPDATLAELNGIQPHPPDSTEMGELS